MRADAVEFHAGRAIAPEGFVWTAPISGTMADGSVSYVARHPEFDLSSGRSGPGRRRRRRSQIFGRRGEA